MEHFYSFNEPEPEGVAAKPARYPKPFQPTLWLPGRKAAAMTREPRLMVPRQKPIGPVKVNWANPITQNLAYCFLFNRLVTKCLVSGIELPIYETTTPGNANVRATTSGIGVHVLQGTGDTPPEISIPAITEATGCSHFVHAHPQMGYGALCFLANSDKSSRLSINNRADGEYVGCTLYGGANRTLGSSTYLYSSPASFHSLVVVSSSSCKSYWPNGEIITATGTTFTFDRLSPFFYTALSSWQGRAVFLSAFVWKRPLSDSEAKSVMSDPYQFLVPA